MNTGVKILIKIIGLSVVAAIMDAVGLPDFVMVPIIVSGIFYLFMRLETVLKYVLPAGIVIGIFDLAESFGSGDIETIISGLAIIGLILYYVKIPKKSSEERKRLREARKEAKRVQKPQITQDKIEHYRNSGLTDNEIQFFRDTMAELKTQIVAWERNVNKSPKLKAIDLRTDALKGAKALFKELVKEPKRLTQASDFVHKHVPTMLELTNKFIEIEQHDLKDSDTYAVLQKSTEGIEIMGKAISRDYLDFVKNDLEDMDYTIQLAKKNLNMDNDSEEETKSEMDTVASLTGVSFDTPAEDLTIPDLTAFRSNEQEKNKEKVN
jgi:5-bromo-4-chloroindolyl phosphate hydrolysis protein